ncbi:MAG: 30S ribosomal protein S20 [Verrucomicrobiota bacterium]|nr:30S ribosomal protein S20 [Verrucomicrobiota bacterium]
MANLKSSKKDIRRTISRTERNRTVKSKLKTLKKHVDGAIEAKDTAKVTATSKGFISALDKAAKVGIVHKNKVNRLKSRLASKTKKAAAVAV